jgi:hypothetical protein
MLGCYTFGMVSWWYIISQARFGGPIGNFESGVAIRFVSLWKHTFLPLFFLPERCFVVILSSLSLEPQGFTMWSDDCDVEMVGAQRPVWWCIVIWNFMHHRRKCREGSQIFWLITCIYRCRSVYSTNTWNNMISGVETWEEYPKRLLYLIVIPFLIHCTLSPLLLEWHILNLHYLLYFNTLYWVLISNDCIQFN